MKKIYYHYGNGAKGSMIFPANATLEEISLKIGTNAIITNVESGDPA